MREPKEPVNTLHVITTQKKTQQIDNLQVFKYRQVPTRDSIMHTDLETKSTSLARCRRTRGRSRR